MTRKSEPFASIDGAEGVEIRAFSANSESEHSLTLKLARVFISDCWRGITVACAVPNAESFGAVPHEIR